MLSMGELDAIKGALLFFRVAVGQFDYFDDSACDSDIRTMFVLLCLAFGLGGLGGQVAISRKGNLNAKRD